MKFFDAIDEFLADKRQQGRVNSRHTELSYRSRLEHLGETVSNRDPRLVGRDDLKRALRKWQNPNSAAHAHAIYTSFFTWLEEEGHRDTNPARQVSRPRTRQPTVYRLTRGEVVSLLDASMPVRRERWAIHLMLLAGLRRGEVRHLQGRHLQREGWVWVSPDIAKGGRERWVPVLGELAEVVSEIQRVIEPDGWVIEGTRSLNPPAHTEHRPSGVPLAAESIYKMVVRVAKRAGIAGQVTPHTLRHGFGDHVAKYAGLRAAQALMGHASVETTASVYVDRPSLDEIAVSVSGFSFRRVLSVPDHEESPHSL